MRARSPWLVGLLFAVGEAAHAQAGPELARALELERDRRHAEAADLYERVIDREPSNLQALFGLERVYGALGRVGEIPRFVDEALEREPDNDALRALSLSVYGRLGDMQGVGRAAEDWIARNPSAAEPYREWAFAVSGRGDMETARRVLERGRERLGPHVLGAELAQVAAFTGDWHNAARHWHEVVDARPDQAGVAAASLGQAPSVVRDAVLAVLAHDIGDLPARRLAADLLAGWGRPGEGWTLLDASLPADRTLAAQILRRFAERIRGHGSPESERVRGYALERLAGLTSGTDAQMARVDAARAFADAGDRAGAERMLDQMSRDPTAAPSAAVRAMAGLIAVRADVGQVAEAERRFLEWRDRLSGDEVAQLMERIARAWIRRGDLDRADRIVAGDSSVASSAIRGWVALYRGELGAAGERFGEAGPFSGTRAEATERTAAIALIERLGPDRRPEIGSGLFAVARGDTARGINILARAARALPARGGRGDLLTYAGMLALAGDPEAAGGLFRAALSADESGPAAPQALLGLADAGLRMGRVAEAVEYLEHLILVHGESALVPQARRLLDQARGVVPRS